MNTIAPRDQFKPIRIEENLVVKYNGQQSSSEHSRALTMWHSSFRGSGQNGIDFRIILWKIIVFRPFLFQEKEMRSARRLLLTPALSGILNRFSVEIYLFFQPRSPAEILKLTPQRQHPSQLVGFAVFWSQRRVFQVRSAFIRLNTQSISYFPDYRLQAVNCF